MYLTVKEVATRYKVTPDCIRKWVQKGSFPKPVKFNGSTRWELSAIENWESTKK